MTNLRFCSLSGLEQPLLNKFYKSQGSPMRATANGQCWVARDQGIVAALCLSPVGEGHWLTGLWVEQAYRQQGIAGRLIDQAIGSIEGPVWLFCHPDLSTFYQRQGFAQCMELPAPLAERLARYQRSKPLLAMIRAQSSLAGSSPGNSTSV
nr:GNAT family N-acetyltransferase [Pseudomonas sp. BGr12]MDL2422405.1 GNAT family N-acetyltransferase [Pseudomonas sp. BGr12]